MPMTTTVATPGAMGMVSDDGKTLSAICEHCGGVITRKDEPAVNWKHKESNSIWCPEKKAAPHGGKIEKIDREAVTVLIADQTVEVATGEEVIESDATDTPATIIKRADEIVVGDYIEGPDKISQVLTLTPGFVVAAYQHDIHTQDHHYIAVAGSTVGHSGDGRSDTRGWWWRKTDTFVVRVPDPSIEPPYGKFTYKVASDITTADFVLSITYGSQSYDGAVVLRIPGDTSTFIALAGQKEGEKHGSTRGWWYPNDTIVLIAEYITKLAADITTADWVLSDVENMIPEVKGQVLEVDHSERSESWILVQTRPPADDQASAWFDNDNHMRVWVPASTTTMPMPTAPSLDGASSDFQNLDITGIAVSPQLASCRHCRKSCGFPYFLAPVGASSWRALCSACVEGCRSIMMVVNKGAAVECMACDDLATTVGITDKGTAVLLCDRDRCLTGIDATLVSAYRLKAPIPLLIGDAVPLPDPEKDS